MHTDPTQTSPQIQADAVAFYNALMWDIEPELTTDILPDLDALYADESAEDRTVRLQWYEDAFAVFQQRAREVKAEGKAVLQKVLKNIAKLSQQQARGAEEKKLSSLEDSLADS